MSSGFWTESQAAWTLWRARKHFPPHQCEDNDRVSAFAHKELEEPQ
jgi:hypothetical protein